VLTAALVSRERVVSRYKSGDLRPVESGVEIEAYSTAANRRTKLGYGIQGLAAVFTNKCTAVIWRWWSVAR
jgi:hypothetical protein